MIELTRPQGEHWEVSIMCYPELLLTHLTPDSHVTVLGFHLLRGDWVPKETAREKVGELQCI